VEQRPFEPYITLAFSDLPESLLDEVLDYLLDAPLPAEPFLADRYHLLELESPDWAGDWAQACTWRLLKAWRV
jgi:hypothetical protein